MPRYQAVIEFWAYSDNHADDHVRQAKEAVVGLSLNTKEAAQAEGIATGEVEVKSLLQVQTLAPEGDDSGAVEVEPDA